MDVDGPDTGGAGTAAMLYAGAIIGVVLRAATWICTSFTVGPLLGLADLLAGDWAPREVLFAQAVVTVVAVVAAVLCGLGIQSEPERYRRPVRLLSALFVVDIVLYLVPLIAAAAIDTLTTPAWIVFGVTVVGNLGLAGLAILIGVRAGAAPARPVGSAADAAALT
jgi:hypothetical protein